MYRVGVIQLIDSLNPGGAEVLAVNIANGLSEKGINSHICATRKEGIIKQNINKSTSYLFLNRKKKIDYKAILTFKAYLKNNKISLIHAHSTSFFFAICVKIVYPTVKIVWHDHYGKSEELESRSSLTLKISSIFFHAIVSVNTILEKWAKENLYCSEVFFLKNFAEFNNHKKTTNLNGIKGKRIIHLAAFREQKDHENLINAFYLFLKENKGWTMHLVGKFNIDGYYKKCIDLIEKKELKKSIFIYGSCLDIHNILEQSTIGVLSSNSEGLPLTLLEYGLAKLPVITTNVGQCGDVIVDKESGYVVVPKNHFELSNKLDLLVNSEKDKFNFSIKHHNNVKKHFSKKVFIENLIKIYTT